MTAVLAPKLLLGDIAVGDALRDALDIRLRRR